MLRLRLQEEGHVEETADFPERTNTAGTQRPQAEPVQFRWPARGERDHQGLVRAVHRTPPKASEVLKNASTSPKIRSGSPKGQLWEPFEHLKPV